MFAYQAASNNSWRKRLGTGLHYSRVLGNLDEAYNWLAAYWRSCLCAKVVIGQTWEPDLLLRMSLSSSLGAENTY